MNYSIVLTNLYFVLIYSDGQVNEHELATGQQILKTESIKEEDFSMQMEMLKSIQTDIILSESIPALKKLSRDQQIRIVAWLCVVANGDGFMDKAEWALIYRIYYKELNLSLEDIFKVQKQLTRASRQNTVDAIIKSVA
jgi:uncharacterized tellurite resistance protein B-like protein